MFSAACRHCPSAKCVTAANLACVDVDIVSRTVTSLQLGFVLISYNLKSTDECFRSRHSSLFLSIFCVHIPTVQLIFLMQTVHDS